MWRISETVRLRLSVVPFHQDGDSARTVALEDELLVGGALQLARALLDGALDVVGGHVHGLGLVHRGAQAGVRDGVTAADTGRDRHLADDLGEDLPALGVERALLVLDGMPLGMSGHGSLLLALGPRPRQRRKRPNLQQKSPDGGAIEAFYSTKNEKSRQRPTLPPGRPDSTIGAGGLNGRVRNGNGCDPSAMVTGMNCQRAALTAENPLHGVGSARRHTPGRTNEDHHVFKHYKRYGQASRPISTRKLKACSALTHRAYQPRSLRGVFRQVILRETSSCGGFHA